MKKPDAVHIELHCRPVKGKPCRYLVDGRCLKSHVDAKIVIDFRVEKGTHKATGDNCAGYQHQ